MTIGPVRLETEGRWPDDIIVWHVDTQGAPDELRPMLKILDATELQRSQRFSKPEDRACFIVTRSSLR